jgi:ParB family chromosome partitioning protein
MAKDTKSRKRLGRGLSSLIAGDTSAPQQAPAREQASVEGSQQYVPEQRAAKPAQAASGTPRQVAVDKIQPNPYQPRKEFNDEQLAELTASIRAQGVLQPLVVSADGSSDEGYLLIAGERRLRAAKLAGLDEVPCVIRQATDQQRLEWALVENIQRSDLNPMEKARAYRSYIDRFQLSQAQAAQRLGQARATVANFLRLMELPEEVQEMVRKDLLSFGHAKALAGLASPPRQTRLARQCVEKQLSVRKLEELIQQADQDKDAPTSDNTRRAKPAYLQDLEERFRQAVGTRVSIKPGRSKHTGRIVIEYYSFDDFDRIAGSLGVEGES